MRFRRRGRPGRSRRRSFGRRRRFKGRATRPIRIGYRF